MHELVLRLPESLVEAVSEALVDELDALSVAVADADAGTAAEQALFGEPGMPVPREGWQRSELTALFETEAAATEAATLLRAQDWASDMVVLALREVAEQDWVRLTQSQFAPVEITPSFWIVPSWHAAPAAAVKVIRLDPGLAFGTGTHPTTGMCLSWLDAEAQSAALTDARVLDYGCGSGILAIAALALGAHRAVGVDIDPQALIATQANAARNDCADRLTVGEVVEPGEPFAILVANILSGPLVRLAPELRRHAGPDTRVALSGILSDQAPEVIAAFKPWVCLTVADAQDDWVLLAGTVTR